MAAPANPKEEGEEKEEEDSSSPSSSSRPFASAVAAIAVAQICGGAGFTAAEPFALRALSDVAALYIEALARSAAAHANARGRTDSNLLDLVRALEELEAAACGGSLGGSDPARLLLRSSVLTELMAFVRDRGRGPIRQAHTAPRRERRRETTGSAELRGGGERAADAARAAVAPVLPGVLGGLGKRGKGSGGEGGKRGGGGGRDGWGGEEGRIGGCRSFTGGEGEGQVSDWCQL